MSKRIIEGRRHVDGHDLIVELAKLLKEEDGEWGGIYLQGNQYIIIEVVEND